MTFAAALDVNPTLAAAFDAPTFSASMSVEMIVSAAFPPKGTERRFLIVDPDGEPLGEIENAVAGKVEWRLNKPTSWSFSVSVFDPKASLITAQRFREVQVWRGDQLLTWGPIVRVGVSAGGMLEVSGYDCLWYLYRRFIGDADRRNYIPNPSFESGLTGWTTSGFVSPREPVAGRTGAVITVEDRAILGTKSAKLDRPSDTWPQYGSILYHSFGWEAPATDPENVWTAAVWCYVPSSDFRGWTNDVISEVNGGLFIGRYSTTAFTSVESDDGAVTTLSPDVIEEASRLFTDDTPKDQWFRLEVPLTVPTTGSPELIHIGLHGILGSVYWDAASLTLNERLLFTDTDQALIAEGIVEHAQDPAYSKSELRIGTDCPLTGVVRDREYVHSEHPGVGRALDEFVDLDNGFDHRIEYTPTTRTYRIDFPQAGSYRPRYGLDYGGNVVAIDWQFDGEAATSSVVILGDGDGSDREEGAAVDTSTYANGLTLEEVIVAPPESKIDALDNQAAEALAIGLDPQTVKVRTKPNPSKVIGYVKPGDIVPLTAYRGALEIPGDPYRIVTMTLETDSSVTMTLNRRAS